MFSYSLILFLIIQIRILIFESISESCLLNTRPRHLIPVLNADWQVAVLLCKEGSKPTAELVQ